jgi:soluble lytic murein transglycosylase-like protein
MLKCQSTDNTVSYATEQIAGTKCISIKTVLDRPAAARPALYRNGKTSIAFSGKALSGSAIALSTSSARITKPPAVDPRATMYSYVDNGIRYYSSSKPVALPSSVLLEQLHFSTTCFLCVPTQNVDIAKLVLNTRAYRREIEAAALDFGVDQAIVRAVIHAESAFEPHAMSAAGAQGLMQLMPATAIRFGVHDAFDAAQNIRGGVQYLAWLLKHFDGNLDEALAGYNAGENAVGRYNDVPPYPETRYYVSRVKRLADRYRNMP